MSSPEPAHPDSSAGPVRLVAVDRGNDLARAEALVESYRSLADVFHAVLAEQTLDALLDRIADRLSALVPYDELVIFEADDTRRMLTPVLVRSNWAEEIVNDESGYGVGITGWAVEHREPVHTNAAHLDPRVRIVPGTPVDPEALIVVPLVARGALKGALNIYRVGDGSAFDALEFELAKRFADAAALAIDNAHIRARLEHQAKTDALTGLFNHRYFHERVRSELQRASRLHMPVGVLMLDIDNFKRVNDIHGHGVGDEILVELAETLRDCARGSDVLCRIGGEEFAVILPATNAESAAHFAERLTKRVAERGFGGVESLTLSIGFAAGPSDASNPRELVACGEAAMMTAKARGKNQFVVYREGGQERPDAQADEQRDLRSIAHLKLLKSLSGKLSRLNDVREVGLTIANELRSLIDYHNCRVFVVDGDAVVPVAFRGELSSPASTIDVLKLKVGEGITGHVIATGKPLLAGDAARSEHGAVIPGTDAIDESLLAVPMRYGTRVIGAIVISKLGFDQFDGDDLRLLEVLAGQAAVALENARLFDAQRREAETADALLESAGELANAHGVDEVLASVAAQAGRLLGSERTAAWIENENRAGQPPALPAELRSSEMPFVFESEGAGYAVTPIATTDGTRAYVAAMLTADELHSPARPLRLLAGLAHQAKLALARYR